jgi:hypothetical protein
MKLYLTFDCEDFINPVSTQALKHTLKLMQKYSLRGIFFLTGELCEKLRDDPEVLYLLETHEIGYHSTSHSVHPGIFEYTDIQDYKTACKIALKRETSTINPSTGETEGEGGLLTLQNVFPRKRIVSFRAPGFCWSPPHLEALEKLGIQFDFSTNLSPIPIHYKRITFYPFPILEDEMLTSTLLPLGNIKWTTMARLIMKSAACFPLVFFIHPHDFTNAEYWDRGFFIDNHESLRSVRTRNWFEIERRFRCFELFLRRVQPLANKRVLEVTPTLEEGLPKTRFTNKQVLQSYRRSIIWCTNFFNYTPKFLLNHFYKYLNTSARSPRSEP